MLINETHDPVYITAENFETFYTLLRPSDARGHCRQL